jgi:hypothetical protein
VSTFYGLTDVERRELGAQLGHVVTYFAEAAMVARKERDAAARRADDAERKLAAYKRRLPDGDVLATKVSS